MKYIVITQGSILNKVDIGVIEADSMRQAYKKIAIATTAHIIIMEPEYAEKAFQEKLKHVLKEDNNE